MSYQFKHYTKGNTVGSGSYVFRNYTTQVAPTVEPYLTFSSPNSFTISVRNNTKNWDGTLEYSTDKTTWTEWNGASGLSGVSDGVEYVLYLRGTGNTVISGNSSQRGWSLSGEIYCDGNIETLLDYQTVVNGNHPPMANNCFAYMFYNAYNNFALKRAPDLPALTLSQYCYYQMFYYCAGLTATPELPATTLANSCYNSMFGYCSNIITTTSVLPATTLAYQCYNNMYTNCTSLITAPNILATKCGYESCRTMFNACTGLINAPIIKFTDVVGAQYGCFMMFAGCTNLTSLPALSATTLDSYCYGRMFSGCTKIKISETQVDDYQNAYRIPVTGTGIDSSNGLYDTFQNTGGTFTGTPTINTTYYTSNAIVNSDGTITPGIV